MKVSPVATRMKAFEAEFRQTVPARSYTVVRLDGKAFHTYTRGLARPFDEQFAADMDATAVEVLKEASGARFAYVQSDEISILLTDFAQENTEAWLAGVVPKIVSISAAVATAAFNELRPGRRALFDSRVFALPAREDVVQYLRWRQDDARRNSIQSFGQSLFSARQLHGLSVDDVVDKARQEFGQSWDEQPDGFRRGRLIRQEQRLETITFTHKRTGREETVDALRSHWVSGPAFDFRESAELVELIPEHPDHIEA